MVRPTQSLGKGPPRPNELAVALSGLGVNSGAGILFSVKRYFSEYCSPVNVASANQATSVNDALSNQAAPANIILSNRATPVKVVLPNRATPANRRHTT